MPQFPHDKREVAARLGTELLSVFYESIALTMSQTTETSPDNTGGPPHVVGSDFPFVVTLTVIGATYVLLLLSLLVADVAYMVVSGQERDVEYMSSVAEETVSVTGWSAVATIPASSVAAAATAADFVELPDSLAGYRSSLRPLIPIIAALRQREIQYSVKLTLISCLFTALLSILVAVPIGYSMSRYRFPGRDFIDALLDIPIVLPPLIVGLSLLILFQFSPFRWIAEDVVYRIPAVIIAQFMVAAAFAVRVMRATFEQIDPRVEQVALTLGCSQAQAFGRVVLPQAMSGILTAGTLSWARAMGEFGPLLIFAGATRMKTEVLSTTVFLELSIGNLEAAVAVSLIMVLGAVIVLLVARYCGNRAVIG